jgi:hypothetical protein
MVAGRTQAEGVENEALARYMDLMRSEELHDLYSSTNII